MIVKSITIGGWFQRTTLHLTEVYNFLIGKDIPGLDKKTLQKNLKGLNLISAKRVGEEIEYIDIKLKGGIQIKFFEDGLVTLDKKVETDEIGTIKKEIANIKSLYEGTFSPCISYVFSRGAPVPKELAKIENIYPFILNAQTESTGEVEELFEKLGETVNSSNSEGNVGIYKGKTIMVISNLTDSKIFEIFKETEIFFREFKTQLARYLHIHREIWEKIKLIKERDSIRGRDILKIREELQEEQKTINLIEARIGQMPAYLKTRQKLTDISVHKELHPLFQYKFETLLDTHDYIKSLWAMTKNYMNSANDMLGVLQAESTKSSISSLTLITTIGVVAGIVNYMVRDTFPKVTKTGFYYFLMLLVATFLINLGVVWYYKLKTYKIKK